MSENSNAIKVVSPFAKPARADGLRAAMHTAVNAALDFMGIEGDPTPEQWAAAALVALAGLQLQAGDIHDEHVLIAGDALLDVAIHLENLNDNIKELSGTITEIRDDKRFMFKATNGTKLSVN